MLSRATENTVCGLPCQVTPDPFGVDLISKEDKDKKKKKKKDRCRAWAFMIRIGFWGLS